MPNKHIILVAAGTFVALRALEVLARNYGWDWTALIPAPSAPASA